MEKQQNKQRKKYRLMQITHDLAIGGLQQVVVNICRTINRDVFDVFVLCLRNKGEFASDIEGLGIEVLYLPQSNKTDYLSFFKVARILRDRKIDIVHTHNTQPFVDGTLAALLSNVKTIIHTDHARNFPDKKRYMFAEKIMSLFADKVVGVSEHTAKNLMDYEGISPKKIAIVPNGIDETKYTINIDKNKKRKAIAIRDKGPVIGLGVRLTEQKGITYLLQAMPEIIKEFPDISLVIAGSGELEQRLKDEAVDLNLTDNVFFIGPRLDMHEILQLFDAYVLPSLWEGLPMVLIEAMASRCPIIATDVGGNSDAIENEINGILIPPKSPEMICSSVIRMLKDGTLRDKFKNNAYENFQEKFSASIMTRRYESLYLNGAL